MNDAITLADPAVSCDAAIDAARRVEAWMLMLASPRGIEIQSALPDLLSIIRTEASHMRERAEDAAEAIRHAAG
jgi:hypothetical protein